MAINGAAIQAKIRATLARVNATSKTWKFRQVNLSGGNSRLGIYTDSDIIDLDLDPQPAEEYVSGEDVATSGGLFMMGDYKLTMSGDTDEDLLRTRQLVRGDDVCRIVRYWPYAIDGTVVAFIVVARVSQPNS